MTYPGACPCTWIVDGGDIYQVRGMPDALLVRIGKGWLLLDRTSFDDSSFGNAGVGVAYADWRSRLEAAWAGPKPDEKSPGLVRCGGHADLREWLTRGASTTWPGAQP